MQCQLALIRMLSMTYFNCEAMPTNNIYYSCHTKLYNLFHQSYGVHITPHHITSQPRGRHTYAHFVDKINSQKPGGCWPVTWFKKSYVAASYLRSKAQVLLHNDVPQLAVVHNLCTTFVFGQNIHTIPTGTRCVKI